VIAVTSVDSFRGLDQDWLPDMRQFSRIRIDVILPSLTSEILRDYFDAIVGMLRERALSVQILEVRIGFSHLNAFAAAFNHRSAADRDSSAAVRNRSTAVLDSSLAIRDRHVAALSNHRSECLISSEDVMSSMCKIALMSRRKVQVGESKSLQIC
jgi:hypothetical protein